MLKNLLIRLIATQALTEKRREENIFNNIKSNTSDECFSVLLRMPAKPLLTIERLSPIRALSHFTAFRCCITENRRKLADECLSVWSQKGSGNCAIREWRGKVEGWKLKKYSEASAWFSMTQTVIKYVSITPSNIRSRGFRAEQISKLRSVKRRCSLADKKTFFNKRIDDCLRTFCRASRWIQLKGWNFLKDDFYMIRSAIADESSGPRLASNVPGKKEFDGDKLVLRVRCKPKFKSISKDLKFGTKVNVKRPIRRVAGPHSETLHSLSNCVNRILTPTRKLSFLPLLANYEKSYFPDRKARGDKQHANEN